MPERLRVLHVVGGGEYGGAEQYLVDLLTRLDPTRFEPRLACFYEARLSQTLRSYGITTAVVPNQGPRDWRLSHGIERLIHEFNPTIVHTHGVRANYFGRLAARRAGNAAVATTVHSLLRYDYPRLVGRLIAYAMEFRSKGWADGYIAISQAIARDLVRRGVPRGRIQVIHHGIDLARFGQTSRLEARKKLGLAPDARVVGMAARFHPVKGHRTLLHAVASVRQTFPDLQVALVGDGPLRDQIQALARSLGLAGCTHFMGFRPDVPELLPAFDVLANPSLSEGLGLTVLEAMASSVPVVATAVGGVPDIVEDGQSGLLVPVGDATALARALAALLGDPERASRLAVAGRQRVAEAFTVNRMARETEAYYEGLVGSRI